MEGDVGDAHLVIMTADIISKTSVESIDDPDGMLSVSFFLLLGSG